MARIRVGINARLLSDSSMRGWTRYSLSLIRAMAETGDVEICLLTDLPIAEVHRQALAKNFDSGAIRELASGPCRYPSWQENWLRNAIREEKIAVYHTPYHYGVPWWPGCPSVATLHDAIDATMPVPLAERFSRMTIKSRYYLWQTRKMADRIITVSEFSADQLQRRLGIPRRKIRVVPEAADAIFHKLVSHEEIQSLRNFSAISAKPYVFYVGGLEGRKNFEVVLKAIAAMQQKGAFQLVLAGGAAADRARLEAIAKDLKVSEFVSFLGRVPDEHLPGLYSGAMAMVYPSRLEGFGLQLVEAMARGCPMVVSRATSLPEVAGHAGEYFDPDDAAGLAAILDRLAIDKNYEDWLRGKSAERSGSFSWEIAARGTLDVYRELVNG